MTVGLIIAVVVVLLLAIIVFKLMWRVAEPNEALLISGAKQRTDGVAEGMGFRIVTGRGTLVLPGIQAVRKLSLDLNAADLAVECVTKQGIPVHLRGIVIFKVGDDFASIANAARRFLDQQKQMGDRVHNVFAGHLRSIVGGLTVEELIRERERMTEQTRASCGAEMEKLGLIIDSLQIQEIVDATGYIQNLAAPHAAAVQRDARIAAANADRDATEAEQEAAGRKAEATRNSEILQAGYQAERDEAAARARQAGPLSEATARQQVIVQQTKAAELEAEKREQQLQADVRKPADAEAYRQRTIAEAEAEAFRVLGQAEADAAKARGLAEAESVKARGLAEAASIKARAEALALNQEAVVAQQLAENWPEIVRAGAEAFGNVEHMVILNGADGVSDMLGKALTMGGTGLGLARQLLSTMNGGAGVAAKEPVREPVKTSVIPVEEEKL